MLSITNKKTLKKYNYIKNVIELKFTPKEKVFALFRFRYWLYQTKLINLFYIATATATAYVLVFVDIYIYVVLFSKNNYINICTSWYVNKKLFSDQQDLNAALDFDFAQGG